MRCRWLRGEGVRLAVRASNALQSALAVAVLLVASALLMLAQLNATPTRPQTQISKAADAAPSSTWQTELVDSVPGHQVGWFSSLGIDRGGNLHIAYTDETALMLRYAYRGKNDKKWFALALGPGKGVSSLAVDSDGRPHIAYINANGGGLRYVAWDGKEWHSQLIDNQRIEYFTSIQIDSQNHPKISYYQRLYADSSYALRLKYAYFDGTTWFTQTVDQRFGTGKFNSLALDTAGNPHIAYSDTNIFALRYVYWDGSRWLYELPDTSQMNGGVVGYEASIVVDARGNPYIAYLDATNHRIKYVYRAGNRWVHEIVDRLVGAADLDNVSIKLDNQGQPHIAYYDSGAGHLLYATRTSKGWISEVVDESGAAGMYPSLCFNPDGEPYISYYDVANGVLRIAHRSSGANQ